MLKARRILPGILRVAIQTSAAQLSCVDVPMATDAACVQASKRRVQIATLEQQLVFRIDEFRRVAFCAL